MVEIKEINHSIAYCVYNPDTGKKWIEVNKHLKEDPILYKAVLSHEKQHLVSQHRYMDFWLDLKPKWYSWRLLRWCLRHPKSFLCYSPIFIEKGKVSINPFMILMLLVIGFLVALDVILLKLLL